MVTPKGSVSFKKRLPAGKETGIPSVDLAALREKYPNVQDKIGYILLKISVSSRSIPLAPVIIEDGEMLCEELFCEIANDVLEYTGNGHDRKNADPLERAEIRRRYQPYIEQFPQYQKLAEEILMGEDSMYP